MIPTIFALIFWFLCFFLVGRNLIGKGKYGGTWGGLLNGCLIYIVMMVIALVTDVALLAMPSLQEFMTWYAYLAWFGPQVLMFLMLLITRLTFR